jgi:hypothetical protein
VFAAAFCDDLQTWKVTQSGRLFEWVSNRAVRFSSSQKAQAGNCPGLHPGAIHLFPSKIIGVIKSCYPLSCLSREGQIEPTRFVSIKKTLPLSQIAIFVP